MYNQTTLDERDGKLYVKYTFTQLDRPKRITLWWPTDMTFFAFAQYYASEERAREIIGRDLFKLSSGYYQDMFNNRYGLTEGGNTKAEFTQEEDVPEPKQRGRKLPVRWSEGRWQKETVHGWVTA